MKKITTTIAMMMAMALSLFAQIPQTMSYQAVVRNAENAIVASQSVSIELSVLQGSDEGTAVYTETHNATTNANGLITLELGAGESSDNFSAIDWSAGPYFVKTVAEIDGKQVSGVSPMLVVPYAKYAETAGNVPDMSEYAKKSEIKEVDLSNYATKSELPSLEGYAKTEDIPSLDGYAKTEDLPTVDLSGYATTSEIADMATKTYVDGKVAAVEVPTKVSDLTDAGDYAKTSDVSSAIATATTDMATKTYVDDKVAAVEVPTTVAELTDAGDYTNVQADWSETDATKDSYIKNKPTLATVATSGSYEDLSNKPTIPDVTGFATKTELEDYAKTSEVSSAITTATTDMATKTYVDGKVAAVEVPTTVAELTDATDYAKKSDIPTIKLEEKPSFSVSANKQVYFSQGNLQYQASTGIWRFAENQYDMIGTDNANISDTYTGWIDLFGWGTSGYNGKNPYMTNIDFRDYCVVGDASADIAGTNYDWGVYNAIQNGGNSAGMWRTLTYAEWDYVLSQRTDASALKGLATVNGVTGMILLPDNWTAPAGITFTSGVNGFSSNTYTSGDWSKMDANGAVFLPAGGNREGSNVNVVGSYGIYWSSSADNIDCAKCLYFFSDNALMNYYDRYMGRSVRLVQDTEVAANAAAVLDMNDYVKKSDIQTVDLSGYYKKSDVDALLAELTAKIQKLDEQLNFPEGAIYGKFSVSSDDQVYFSQGNLQYQASTSTWRFADNQYDMIGADNSNISSTYSGWIDLFGWGTSGYNGKNPYMTSTDYSDYGVDGDANADIAGTNYDWGVYNAIQNGGNSAGMWRTLTSDEWNYVLSQRTDASALKGLATVNGVTGMILLPDNWTTPSGITFKNGMNGFDSNTYTTSDWAKMEANGAVFLPATGYRNGSDVVSVGSNGFYWAPSAYFSNYANYLYFRSDYADMSTTIRNYGLSVRLVRGLLNNAQCIIHNVQLNLWGESFGGFLFNHHSFLLSLPYPNNQSHKYQYGKAVGKYR